MTTMMTYYRPLRADQREWGYNNTMLFCRPFRIPFCLQPFLVDSQGFLMPSVK